MKMTIHVLTKHHEMRIFFYVHVPSGCVRLCLFPYVPLDLNMSSVVLRIIETNGFIVLINLFHSFIVNLVSTGDRQNIYPELGLQIRNYQTI